MQRKGSIGEQPETGTVSEQHRYHDPNDRDEPRSGCNRLHFGKRRFESNLEEEEHHAELCEKLDGDELSGALEGGNANHVQIAEDDAGAELAEHGRLVQTYGNLTAHLRGEEHPGEDQPDLVAQSVRIAACKGGGGNRREQSQQQGKACRSAAHRAGP